MDFDLICGECLKEKIKDFDVSDLTNAGLCRDHANELEDRLHKAYKEEIKALKDKLKSHRDFELKRARWTAFD